MKKLSITIIIITLNIMVYGQARLGASVSEIKKEFKDKEYNLKMGYDKDNDLNITIEMERAIVIYYFNSHSICTATMIIPKYQGAINYYVETYNANYVVKSTTEWLMYSKNGISNINLIFMDDGGCFFIWTN